MDKRLSGPNAQTTSVTTLDDFRTAVKFLLIQEHGTPEVLADEFLTIDAEYLQAAYEEFRIKPSERTITEVADTLTVKPRKGAKWVRIESDSIVLSTGKQMDEYLANIQASGLFGSDRSEVARAMLCRGVESVISIATATPTKRR